MDSCCPVFSTVFQQSSPLSFGYYHPRRLCCSSAYGDYFSLNSMWAGGVPVVTLHAGIDSDLYGWLYPICLAAPQSVFPSSRDLILMCQNLFVIVFTYYLSVGTNIRSDIIFEEVSFLLQTERFLYFCQLFFSRGSWFSFYIIVFLLP